MRHSDGDEGVYRGRLGRCSFATEEPLTLWKFQFGLMRFDDGEC